MGSSSPLPPASSTRGPSPFMWRMLPFTSAWDLPRGVARGGDGDGEDEIAEGAAGSTSTVLSRDLHDVTRTSDESAARRTDDGETRASMRTAIHRPRAAMNPVLLFAPRRGGGRGPEETGKH